MQLAFKRCVEKERLSIDFGMSVSIFINVKSDFLKNTHGKAVRFFNCIVLLDLKDFPVKS
ncbi:hypothetical protein [Treponema pedis]|nr:hypothetical protein [Treponema pedis]